MKSSFKPFLHTLGSVLFLIIAYFIGQGFARFTAEDAMITAESTASANWGLSFQEEGKAPVANASASYLAEYDAYYIEETDEKKIYLTFDCGFENGCTPAILDALKKHNAPATFFIVGNYLETSPELVKRMVEEGRDCSEVLIQLSAVKAAINNTGKIILEDHIEHCIVDAVEHGDRQAIAELNKAIDRFVK